MPFFFSFSVHSSSVRRLSKTDFSVVMTETYHVIGADHRSVLGVRHTDTQTLDPYSVVSRNRVDSEDP